MRMNSEKFPWHHFSSLYSERVRLDGLCSPFQYQPCPVPHSRPCAFHSTRCVYLLFQCFLNLLCLRSGWEPAFAPPLSASDLAILEEAWGAPTWLSWTGVFCLYFHFLEFANLRVFVTWLLPFLHIAASDTQDAVFKISSCCFSWVIGSRLQPLTCSLPAILLNWLSTLRVQRKQTPVAVNWGYRKLGLWFVAGGNRRVPNDAYKDLASNSCLFGRWEPWILVL